MKVIHPADLKIWHKRGGPTEVAAKFGLSFLQQFFDNPHTNEEVEFSLFTVKSGNQICAVTTEGNVLVVRQYKQGVHEIVWEFPGGFPRGSETACEVGIRELREETGYETATMLHTGTFPLHTRKSPSVFNTLLALDCRCMGKPQLEADEVIEVAEMAPAEFWSMVRNHQFKEPQSIMAAVQAALLGYLPFSCT